MEAIQIKNGEYKAYKLSPKYDDTPNSSVSNNSFNGHEYVDLSLPSGTLWATCNVGDSRYGCSGQYYAWGEVENKTSFDWYSYKYAILNHYQGEFVRLTKYCNKSEYSTNGYIDNLINLQSVDDPATRWGDGWHTPSISQWTELLRILPIVG